MQRASAVVLYERSELQKKKCPGLLIRGTWSLSGLSGSGRTLLHQTSEAAFAGVTIFVVFLAIDEVALGQNRVAVRVDAFDDPVFLPIAVIVATEVVVGVDRFFRRPEPIVARTVVTHRPLVGEAAGLAFGPAFPMLFVNLAVVADSTETLARYRAAAERARSARLDFGNRDNYLFQNDHTFARTNVFLPKADFLSNLERHSVPHLLETTELLLA